MEHGVRVVDIDDFEWIQGIIHYDPDHPDLQQEEKSALAVQIRASRLHYRYDSFADFAESISRQIPKLPYQTTRRLLRLYEFADNPFRQFLEESIYGNVEGIDNEEQLTEFKKALTAALS